MCVCCVSVLLCVISFFFFFNDTATTEIYTLSLHDALPISHPVVVLVHGGGAVHDMKLPEYEAAFGRAGLAVLAFDYRHFGDSDGEPRQLLSIRRQLDDTEAAIRF